MQCLISSLLICKPIKTLKEDNLLKCYDIRDAIIKYLTNDWYKSNTSIPRVQEKAGRFINAIVMTQIYSRVILFILLDRTTFSDHHDTKIIKVGLGLLIV